MKSFSKIFTISLFLFACGAINLFAQAGSHFTATENNLGLIAPGALMGIAWGDYDADGDQDLLVCGGPSVLYRNDVNTSGQFVQVSASAASETGTFFWDVGGLQTNAAVWGDLNNDGRLDLVCGILRVHLNDVDSLANTINLIPSGGDVNGGWGMTLGDYDRDGDLDIALACGNLSNNYAGRVRIFKNDGSGAAYEEVAAELSVDQFIYEAWSPTFIDVDNDQFVDLWMPDIRTEEPCTIFKNDQGTEFLYQSSSETGIEALSGIVSAWGDYNNDGYADVWLHPLVGDDANNGANKFYRNNGDGTFTDIAPVLGLDSTYENSDRAPRGASWGDYDNDGDLDFLIGVRSKIGQQLWNNNGDDTFSQIGADAGLGEIIGTDIRSIMFVDYDNDGFLDIYMKQNGSQPPFLLHNDGGNGNHWIVIKPQGVTNNRAGVGARIRAVAGSLSMTRYIVQGNGNSNDNLWAHFGLGSATTLDSLIVYWPNGMTDVATNITAVDRYVTFKEGEGIIVDVEENTAQVPGSYSLSQNYPNPFNPETIIEFAVPEKSDVRIELVNALGQVVKVLANGNFSAGTHQVKLNASDLASGIYFYKLISGGFVDVKKLVLMK
ncbi:MAG: FG-GAP-like repeat-containing protein [bacterium]